MKLRELTVPESVECTSLDGVPFKNGDKPVMAHAVDFYSGVLRDRGSFGATMEGLLAAVAIQALLKKTKPGKKLLLTQEQWELGCKSIRTPNGAYDPNISHNIIPFMKAWVDAPEVEFDPNAAQIPAP
jgi:hypothetical protein